MNRILSGAAALVLVSLPMGAQTAAPAKAPKPGDRPVASVNGEIITAGQLDELYDRLTPQMHDSYEAAGGKTAFLENYLRKRLLIQEALKANYDKKPEVQADLIAARDSALFDRYVRDVVAAPFVTEQAMKDYYEGHLEDFAYGDTVKVRHIVVTDQHRSKAEALALIGKIKQELFATQKLRGQTDEETGKRLVLHDFSKAAEHYSEDASAPSGGDLGWTGKGRLDPTFEEAAFNMPVGVVSGVVETKFGYHLILVEAKKPRGFSPFESVKGRIRQALLAQHAADVMEGVTRLTNELRGQSKVTIYPENVQ
jgi:peptidyl-prolyl cis-trans isomerase C